jgi:hypothetical protein
MPPEKRTKASHDIDGQTSQSTHADGSPSAGRALAEVYELVEMVLVHLPYLDLLHCTQVSHSWRAIVGNSMKLRRLSYKAPTQISEDDANPLFETASLAASMAEIPRGRDQGRPVLQVSQSLIDTFFDRIAIEDHSISDANKAWEEYNTERAWIRNDFQGVRFPNGWPKHLQEIYCAMCAGFHTHLRHENLHPALRFLEDVDICWKGSGAKLRLELYIVHQCMSPLSCWDHYLAMELGFARSLKNAWEVVERSGLHDDQFAKPSVTDIITPAPALPVVESVVQYDEPEEEEEVEPEQIHLHNGDGLRLQQVLHALVYIQKEDLKRVRERMRQTVPEMQDWDMYSRARAIMQMGFRVRFPRKEDFVALVDGWPDLVQRFEKVACETNELLGGIEAWGWEACPRT